jgi:hypothetical protein
MSLALIVALCLLSAIVGRLVLTPDEALRTVRVRLPALLLVVMATTTWAIFFSVWAVLCFVGGSFYGLSQWWWPQLRDSFDDLSFGPFRAIATGRWEP